MCSKSTFRKKATFSARPHGGDIRATYTQVLRFQYLQKEARSASQMSRGNLAVKQMLPEISRVFGFSPNSVLLGVLNAFWRCPPCCWMVCPPSRGSCLPLSPLVSPSLPCTPSCFPLLDGVSAFPRFPEGLVSPCLPLSPLYPFLFPFVGWCVRLPEISRGSCLPLSPLVSPCLPVGWCVRLPEGLVSPCLPLSPFVSLLVSLVRLPEGLVSPCLPLSPFLFPFVGWWVRLPEGLVSPCLPLSPLYPFLFPFVGWCVPLSPLVSLCLPLSPLVSPCLPVGWCVRLPEALVCASPCLPFCLPLSPFLFPKQCTVSG